MTQSWPMGNLLRASRKGCSLAPNPQKETKVEKALFHPSPSILFRTNILIRKSNKVLILPKVIFLKQT